MRSAVLVTVLIGGFLVQASKGHSSDCASEGTEPGIGRQAAECEEPELPDPWIPENHLDFEEIQNSELRDFVSHDPEDIKFHLYYTPK